MDAAFERIFASSDSAPAPFDDVRQRFGSIRATVGRPTRTEPYLGFSDVQDVLLGPFFQTDLIKAVLFVALRFGWTPADVFTLCQMEGLKVWITTQLATQTDQSTFRKSIKTYYGGKEPADGDAATVARSVMLFEWWGLDELVPFNPTAGDNVLKQVGRAEHDRAFDRAFVEQLSTVIVENPREALTTTGVAVQKKHSTWYLQANPEFHATLLALQSARFDYVRRCLMPKEVAAHGLRVSLDPPFPALVYLYFNSKNPDVWVKAMIALLKKRKERTGPVAKTYAATDLHDAFVNERAPDAVITYVRDHCRALPNCHGYVNALRFEYLRRVYEVLFA